MALLVIPPSRGEMSFVRQSRLDQSSLPQYVNQGWSREERERFYTTSGGSILLPCSWFLALEQKDNLDLLVSDHNITQLHLVPKPRDEQAKSSGGSSTHGCTKDELPVGVAITEIPFKGSPLWAMDRKWVGLSCAFCHTGQLHFTTGLPEKSDQPRLAKATRFTLYVDGGPSMQSNYRFLTELFGALRATVADAEKFWRFAGRVFEYCVAERHATDDLCGNGGVNDAAYRERLRKSVNEYTLKLLSRARIDILEWGFGRFDALGRGSNLVFPNLDPDNLRYANAPVSIPQLWYAWRYEAVQWSGLIRHPIARNISQTVAVGAGLFESKELLSNPATAFVSTTNVTGIVELEGLVRQLQPPDWPGTVLGHIDPELATQGKRLYGERCKHCHLPGQNQAASEVQKQRGQTLTVTIIPRDEIGTDSAYLENARTRSISTGVLSPLFTAQTLPMPKAIELLTTQILEQAQKAGTLPAMYADISANVWAPPAGNGDMGYMARPHAAIWATPPFLHNGSVPTLYDLLSPSELPQDRMIPPAEWDAQWRGEWIAERGSLAPVRPACFLLGDLEFDPVKVGYKVHPCDFLARPDNLYSGFNFIAAKHGNSNKGHEFTDYDKAGKKFSTDRCRQFKTRGGEGGVLGCALTHQERLAIIEYLKTCDLNAWLEPRSEGDPVKWDPVAPPKTNCNKEPFRPQYRSRD
jgi:cytochrome c5